MLESLVRDHDTSSSPSPSASSKLSAELRPLIARSAITFWLAMIAVALSLIAVVSTAPPLVS